MPAQPLAAGLHRSHCAWLGQVAADDIAHAVNGWVGLRMGSWRRRRLQFAAAQLPSCPLRGHACTSGAQGCMISLIGCARGRIWPVRETRRSSLRKICLQMVPASREWVQSRARRAGARHRRRADGASVITTSSATKRPAGTSVRRGLARRRRCRRPQRRRAGPRARRSSLPASWTLQRLAQRGVRPISSP